jgi:alpha-tubulin suppressor-like RCC1 family protein
MALASGAANGDSDMLLATGSIGVATKVLRRVLDDVVGVAAGSDISIALTRDGSLWQWRTGQRPAKILDCGYSGINDSRPAR